MRVNLARMRKSAGLPPTDPGYMHDSTLEPPCPIARVGSTGTRLGYSVDCPACLVRREALHAEALGTEEP